MAALHGVFGCTADACVAALSSAIASFADASAKTVVAKALGQEIDLLDNTLSTRCCNVLDKQI